MHFAAVVTLSWWHVNFLGVGLHNYGFTAGKGTIWLFYIVILAVLIFGVIARAIEGNGKEKEKTDPVGDKFRSPVS